MTSRELSVNFSCTLYYFKRKLRCKTKRRCSPNTSREPIEIIHYAQFFPDGISRLVKKEIYTYYPVAVLSEKD